MLPAASNIQSTRSTNNVGVSINSRWQTNWHVAMNFLRFTVWLPTLYLSCPIPQMGMKAIATIQQVVLTHCFWLHWLMDPIYGRVLGWKLVSSLLYTISGIVLGEHNWLLFESCPCTCTIQKSVFYRNRALNLVERYLAEIEKTQSNQNERLLFLCVYIVKNSERFKENVH